MTTPINEAAIERFLDALGKSAFNAADDLRALYEEEPSNGN